MNLNIQSGDTTTGGSWTGVGTRAWTTVSSPIQAHYALILKHEKTTCFNIVCSLSTKKEHENCGVFTQSKLECLFCFS